MLVHKFCQVHIELFVVASHRLSRRTGDETRQAEWRLAAAAPYFRSKDELLAPGIPLFQCTTRTIEARIVDGDISNNRMCHQALLRYISERPGFN